MSRAMSVSDSVVIAREPSIIYAAVADPTQTGRWSPENLGATVADGSAGSLSVGATFVGRNRRGAMRWSTRCRVIAADPDRRFAFRVEAIGLRVPLLRAPIATWTYELEPIESGTRLTEIWHDDRTGWSDRRARIFDRVVTKSTFAEFNARNIRTTLDRLKATLEKS